MIVHVKMEFDLDTETRRTTNVTPHVVLAEQVHACRYPACAKPISINQTYCNTGCFRAHGTRTRKPRVQLVVPHETPAVEPIVEPAPLLAPQTVAPDYRSFTFPQGGLS